MNTFVESFSTKQLLPPWVSEQCQTWGFLIRVPTNNVQQYLDSYFNGAYPDRAPFHYSPLPDPQFGMLTVEAHSRASSQAPGHKAGWDTLQHTEVYWAFPVRRHRITADNLLIDPELVWVQPFLFDDNPVVVFGNREIWGGEMGMATIVRQENLPISQLHLDLALDGFRKFDPNAKSELLAVLHCRIEPGAVVDLADVLRDKPDLEPLINLLGGSGLFAGQSAADDPAAARGIEVNNVKQFRDAYNAANAVYRAIVAARASRTDIDSLDFYAGDKIGVDFMSSAGVAQMVGEAFGVEQSAGDDAPSDHSEFGPEPDASGIYWDLPQVHLAVELAFSFRSNARFEVIETLHTYGG